MLHSCSDAYDAIAVYALLKVMKIWRSCSVKKEQQEICGAQKSDAFVEVMQLYEMQLWRFDFGTSSFFFRHYI